MVKNNISEQIKLATMAKDIEFIRLTIESIRSNIKTLSDKLDEHYVTKTEFEPIKKIVYGLVGLILIAVVGAILTLVVEI